jgi:hypothetical protein
MMMVLTVDDEDENDDIATIHLPPQQPAQTCFLGGVYDLNSENVTKKLDNSSSSSSSSSSSGSSTQVPKKKASPKNALGGRGDMQQERNTIKERKKKSKKTVAFTTICFGEKKKRKDIDRFLLIPIQCLTIQENKKMGAPLSMLIKRGEGADGNVSTIKANSRP